MFPPSPLYKYTWVAWDTGCVLKGQEEQGHRNSGLERRRTESSRRDITTSSVLALTQRRGRRDSPMASPLLSREWLGLPVGNSNLKMEDEGQLSKAQNRAKRPENRCGRQCQANWTSSGDFLCGVCNLMAGRLVLETCSLRLPALCPLRVPTAVRFLQPRLPCLNHGDADPSFAPYSATDVKTTFPGPFPPGLKSIRFRNLQVALSIDCPCLISYMWLNELI